MNIRKPDEKYLKQLGKNVARIRKANELKQQDLAEKSELDVLTIGAIEQGRRWPRFATLMAISKALDINVSVLFEDIR